MFPTLMKGLLESGHFLTAAPDQSGTWANVQTRMPKLRMPLSPWAWIGTLRSFLRAGAITVGVTESFRNAVLFLKVPPAPRPPPDFKKGAKGQTADVVVRSSR